MDGKYCQALLLIQAAGTAMAKRREMERMCGYPPEYGGDEIVLKAIDDFLSDTHIEHDLKDAVKLAKSLKGET